MYSTKISKVAVLVLLLGLVHESVQDYKWKIYKFNRHQQDPVMVSGFGGSSNTRNADVVVPNAQAETLISGIGFDCSNRPTGPNRDPRYCDLFHACVFGKQVKTYGCSQAGGLSYYDEHLQRCEFTSRNPSGCSNNQYYQASIHFQAHQAASGYGMTAAPVTNPTTNYNPYQPAQSTAAPATYVPLTNPPQTQTPQTLVPITYPPVTYVPQTTAAPVTYQTNTGYNPYNPNTMGSVMTSQPYYTNPSGNNGQTTTQAVEAWRAYVRANEQFTCSGRSDGFYASRWCNVFYRCYQGYKFEFLCAAMTSGDRLWWSQHSTSNTLPQATAQCAFPCDTKRQCTSPGGVLKDNGSPVTESTSDAQRLYSACTATTTAYSQNSQGNSLDDLFVLPDQYSVCQGVADGTFVASPKYCNIFHVCINGQRKDFECAKASNSYDLWWNDATKQCDWPCKVTCSKSLYNSASSAAQIQAQDNSVNSAICQGSGSGSGNYGSGSYGQPSYQTTQSYPTNPTTQQSAYPTAYPTANPTTYQTGYPTVTPATTTQSVNNNYNNNNNFFTIPAAMYGK